MKNICKISLTLMSSSWGWWWIRIIRLTCHNIFHSSGAHGLHQYMLCFDPRAWQLRRLHFALQQYQSWKQSVLNNKHKCYVRKNTLKWIESQKCIKEYRNMKFCILNKFWVHKFFAANISSLYTLHVNSFRVLICLLLI